MGKYVAKEDNDHSGLIDNFIFFIFTDKEKINLREHLHKLVYHPSKSIIVYINMGENKILFYDLLKLVILKIVFKHHSHETIRGG